MPLEHFNSLIVKASLNFDEFFYSDKYLTARLLLSQNQSNISK